MRSERFIMEVLRLLLALVVCTIMSSPLNMFKSEVFWLK
jgi:hypothetical protein